MHLLQRRSSAMVWRLRHCWESSCRTIVTSAAACDAARYEGAYKPELLELIKTQVEDASPSAPLAAALDARLTLLRDPVTHNKVLMIGADRGSDAELCVRQAGALVAYTQPGLLALESLHGFERCLVGRVEVALPERPPHVVKQLWDMGVYLFERKAGLAARVTRWEEQLRWGGLGQGEWSRVVRLLALARVELADPLMQDDVVDLATGTVDVTHALRLTGGFDKPLPRAKRVRQGWLAGAAADIAQFREWLRWLPFFVTGKGEPYEEHAEFRVAIREAPAWARLVCIAPPDEEVSAEMEREGLQSHGELTASETAAVCERFPAIAKQLHKGGHPLVCQGADTSLLTDPDSVGVRLSHLSQLHAIHEVAPGHFQLVSWRGARMAELLAAQALPHNLITVAVVNAAYVPSMVERWLGLCRERVQAEERAAAAAQRASSAAAPRPVAPEGQQQKKQQQQPSAKAAGVKGHKRKRR